MLFDMGAIVFVDKMLLVKKDEHFGILCIILMKVVESQQQIRRINLGFSLFNNKTPKKQRQNFGISIYIRQNRPTNFKRILQRVRQAQSNKQKSREKATCLSFSSKRQRKERQTVDMGDLHHQKKNRKLGQSIQRKRVRVNIEKQCSSLHPQNKKAEQIVESHAQMGVSMPLKHIDQVMHGHLQEKHNEQCLIDPYTKDKYRYIKNAQIDTAISLRNSSSIKKTRNSITKSYKVAGIMLAPQQSQKKILLQRKTLNLFHTTPTNKQRLKIKRKESGVQPWGWKDDSKYQFT